MKKLITSSFSKLALLVALLLSSTSLFANNLELTGAVRDLPYTNNTISFDASWHNSWNVSGLPGNHDAIWVFIKFRECGVTGPWNHALLSTTMADHTLSGSYSFAKPIVTTDKWGNAGAHNTGALIRRSDVAIGNVTGSITLNVVGSTSGTVLDPALEYDISVYGIEMVQVSQGDNTIGDGTTTNSPFSQSSSSDNNPYIFTSEAAGQSVGFSGWYSTTVPANFPKGYDEFYCMKYEVTQGQYADFLNNINGVAAGRWYTTYNNMYNIKNVSGVYTASDLAGGYGDCTDRAMNFLSPQDLLTYLDWAALRPMTEFEYERACRGNDAVLPLQYAWGTTDLVECINIDGGTSGVETCLDLDANCHYRGADWEIIGSGGSGFNTGAGERGPIAAGVFARDATVTRITTGATFWGIMEMSGNVSEFTITPYTNYNGSATSAYDGIWGDGMVPAGLYDEANWPTNQYYSIRGGSHMTATVTQLAISARNSSTNTNYTTRYNDRGGRGVR